MPHFCSVPLPKAVPKLSLFWAEEKETETENTPGTQALAQGLLSSLWKALKHV